MSDNRERTYNIKIVRWILDTRNLWCIPGNFKAREEVQMLRKVVGFKKETPLKKWEVLFLFRL